MLYFPMVVTRGCATRYGRKSLNLETAIRQAQRLGTDNVLVVDPHLNPVWAPSSFAKRVGLRLGALGPRQRQGD